MASHDVEEGGVPLADHGVSDAQYQSLLRIGASFSRIRTAPNGDPYILAPAGYVVTPLDRTKRLPDYTQRHPTFDEPASFIEYVNEFKQEASRIFFDPDKNTALAVIDYDSASAANRGAHRAALVLRLSDAWKRWKEFWARGHSMEETAEYLEENLIEVLEPVGAKLLELLTKVQIDRKTVFRKGVRLQDGTQTFTYNTEDTTGDLALPPKLIIGIPVFEGFEHYKIHVLLRYRLDEGVLRWHFKPLRLDDLMKEICQGISEKLATETELPIYIGRLGGASG